MYKVKNKLNDERKFRDNYIGKDIYVKPKGFVITNRPPEEGEVWKVEKIEEIIPKKTKEVIKNDSSSS